MRNNQRKRKANEIATKPPRRISTSTENDNDSTKAEHLASSLTLQTKHLTELILCLLDGRGTIPSGMIFNSHCFNRPFDLIDSYYDLLTENACKKAYELSAEKVIEASLNLLVALTRLVDGIQKAAKLKHANKNEVAYLEKRSTKLSKTIAAILLNYAKHKNFQKILKRSNLLPSIVGIYKCFKHSIVFDELLQILLHLIQHQDRNDPLLQQNLFAVLYLMSNTEYNHLALNSPEKSAKPLLAVTAILLETLNNLKKDNFSTHTFSSYLFHGSLPIIFKLFEMSEEENQAEQSVEALCLVCANFITTQEALKNLLTHILVYIATQLLDSSIKPSQLENMTSACLMLILPKNNAISGENIKDILLDFISTEPSLTEAALTEFLSFIWPNIEHEDDGYDVTNIENFYPTILKILDQFIKTRPGCITTMIGANASMLLQQLVDNNKLKVQDSKRAQNILERVNSISAPLYKQALEFTQDDAVISNQKRTRIQKLQKKRYEAEAKAKAEAEAETEGEAEIEGETETEANTSQSNYAEGTRAYLYANSHSLSAPPNAFSFINIPSMSEDTKAAAKKMRMT